MNVPAWMVEEVTKKFTIHVDISRSKESLKVPINRHHISWGKDGTPEKFDVSVSSQWKGKWWYSSDFYLFEHGPRFRKLGTWACYLQI
jgi:hypothetical protein